MLKFLRGEILLLQAVPVALIAYLFEHAVMEAGQAFALVAAAALIVSIATASMRVAHHAEILAAKAGDFSVLHTLQALLERPFDEHAEQDAHWADFPPAWASTIEISC